MPSLQLSLKVFSDMLPNDDACTEMEIYFADKWGKYVGQRASLVEEMIIKEKMQAFEKGILGIVGSSRKFTVFCASDLVLAKAYNITGYLPFPNYRSSNELYLTTILQARMLLKFPELRQANVQNLRMSVMKSMGATGTFIDALPLVPSCVLSQKLIDYQRLIQKNVTSSEAYRYPTLTIGNWY